MNLSFHDWIADDLTEGFRFYEEQDVGLGEYFLESIVGDARSLGKTAGIHRKVYGYHRKLGTIFPFGIYYSVTGEEVLVFAILDQRSEPSWIRDELNGRS